jgi:hypothetical protein
MKKMLLRKNLIVGLMVAASSAQTIDQQGYLDARKTYRIGAGIGAGGAGTILIAFGVEQVDMTTAIILLMAGGGSIAIAPAVMATGAIRATHATQEPTPYYGYCSYGLLAAGTVGPFATEVEALFLGLPAAYATAIVQMSLAKRAYLASGDQSKSWPVRISPMRTNKSYGLVVSGIF